jgi:hypothetical protein
LHRATARQFGLEISMTPATLCPRCRVPLDPTQECPRCRSSLAGAGNAWRLDLNTKPPPRWQQSPGGRIILATLVTLGLSYGLLQTGMACMRALGIDATSGSLNPVAGLILFQSFQALAALGGGMFAGAGQERASLLGGLAGLLSGVGVLAAVLAGVAANVVQSYSAALLSPGTPTFDLIMFALPVQHAVMGAIGGFAGSLIWKPLPPLVDTRYAQRPKRPAVRPAAPPMSLRWSGPVAWLRVFLGTGIAVVGAMNAPRIVDFLLRVSDNKLKVMTQLENQVAYGEVYGLAILLGGCFAGATRVNGLKQGVCVGVLVAVIMGATLYQTTASGPLSLLFPVVSALLLGSVGGWFGSELLPPVARRRFRVRFWN